MGLLENIMAKRKQVGADNEVWFHLYHILWVIGLIAMFAFLDWWIALIILGVIGVYFFVFN